MRSSTSPPPLATARTPTLLGWLVGSLFVWVDNVVAYFRRPPRVDFYHHHSKTYLTFSLPDLVRNEVPSLVAGFREPWWLPEGNTQTMYSSLGNFSRSHPVVYERKYVQAPDGGLLTIDVTPPLHSHPIQPGETIIAVAHGLTGGSHEHYVRAPLALLTAPKEAGGLGARGVVLNYRGCNGSPVITPRLYHAGSSDDYKTFVAWASYTFPQSKIFGLGFSLGANIVTKYTGEEGADCPLIGAAVLANPWDFVRGSEHMERGTLINRHIYRYVMGGALQTLLRLHSRIMISSPDSPIAPDHVRYVMGRKNLTLREYDDLASAPMWGFKDATDYYINISSCKVLESVRVPLLGINARSDPLVADLTLPLSKVDSNPWVVLAVTPGGGHMGWFEQYPDGSVGRWYAKPVKEYFAALLEHQHDLPARPPLRFVADEAGWIRQEGKEDVAFLERSPDSLDIFASGTGESKLFSGW